eukprot:717050-Prymnesium_polylepis.2
MPSFLSPRQNPRFGGVPHASVVAPPLAAFSAFLALSRAHSLEISFVAALCAGCGVVVLEVGLPHSAHARGGREGASSVCHTGLRPLGRTRRVSWTR